MWTETPPFCFSPEKSTCCFARSIAAMCSLLLTTFFICDYREDFRSLAINIAYFMAEIKAFEAYFYIKALSVEGAVGFYESRGTHGTRTGRLRDQQLPPD